MKAKKELPEIFQGSKLGHRGEAKTTRATKFVFPVHEKQENRAKRCRKKSVFVPRGSDNSCGKNRARVSPKLGPRSLLHKTLDMNARERREEGYFSSEHHF